MHDTVKIISLVALSLPPLIGLVGWPFIVLMSFMSFDAPGSISSPLTIGLFISVLAYPWLTLLGAKQTYQNVKTKEFRRCFQSLLLTYSGTFTVALMSMAIYVFCAGEFVCN